MLDREQLTEKIAKTLAVANNGGDWAEHYKEKQKQAWRERAVAVIDEIIADLTPDDGEECPVCGICP